MAKANVVTGVLPSGLGGSNDNGRWTLTFWLKPWRLGDGEPSAVELLVRIRMSYEQVQEHMRRLEEGDVLRLQVSRPKPLGERLECTGKLPYRKVKAADLVALAAKAAALEAAEKPLVIKHPALGKAVWQRQLQQFAAQGRLGGRRVQVGVDRPDGKPTEARDRAALDRAAKTLARVDRRYPTILREVTGQLLELYNDVWADGRTLDARRFAARLKPYAINCWPDGRSALWLRDGGLFRNHSIQVDLGRTGKVGTAMLAG